MYVVTDNPCSKELTVSWLGWTDRGGGKQGHRDGGNFPIVTQQPGPCSSLGFSGLQIGPTSSLLNAFASSAFFSFFPNWKLLAPNRSPHGLRGTQAKWTWSTERVKLERYGFPFQRAQPTPPYSSMCPLQMLDLNMMITFSLNQAAAINSVPNADYNKFIHINAAVTVCWKPSSSFLNCNKISAVFRFSRFPWFYAVWLQLLNWSSWGNEGK